MALEKIQSFIQKLSETPNVKKVVNDVQNLREQIQSRVDNLNTTEAVKKYKEVAKKVTQAEAQLQKEVTKVITQLRTTADEAEKNLNAYKKMALKQKSKIEKILKAKSAEFTQKAAPAQTKKAKSTVKKSTKAAAKGAAKTGKKKSVRKAKA